MSMQIINFTNTNNGNHGGSSNYENHDIDVVTTGANLPYSDSTVEYQIELINLGTDPNGIFEVTGLPSNLEYSFSGYTEQDKICDDNTPSNCSKLARKKIYMTISYKANGYNSTTTTYPITLNFDFRAFHSITYSGFSGSYRDYVIDGGNLNVTFNTGDIPGSVGVVGATNNYASPTLTLTNVVGNVTVTKRYNITYTGFTGSTSGLPSSIVYSGGTITFDNTSGIPNSVTVTGATGSYTSPTLTLSNITGNITVDASYGGGNVIEDDQTTTYDPSNIPPSSTILYTAIAGNPQVSTDANGNITSFQYTNASSTNPVAITTNNTVSTGFVPFASNTNWELNMTFKYSSEDNGSTSAATTVGILGCISWSGSQINSGFTFRFYNFKNVGSGTNTYKYNNMLKHRTSIWKENENGTTTQALYGLFNTNGSGMIATTPMVYSIHITKVGSTVTFTLTNHDELIYNPTKNENTAAKGLTSAAANTAQTISWTDTGISNSVDITIGGYLNSSGNIDRKADMDVYNFEVHKTN